MSAPSRPNEPLTGTPAAQRASTNPRNPVERAVVWTLIGAMLVLVAVEASAKFGYDLSRSSLEAAIKTAEDSNTPLLIEQVPALMTGYHRDTTQETEHDGVVTYRWPSLFKQYGLNVRYRSNLRTVVGVSSDNAPPEQPRIIASAPPEEEEGETAEGAQGDGQAPPGEGRGRFDPMQYDADKDGRLSKEEVAASNRMSESFARIDTNSDGFADAEELTAWRASRLRPAGDEGTPAPEGGSRRPEADTPAGNAPPGETPPATSPPAAEAPAAAPGATPP
jgi:hypothetical protein